MRTVARAARTWYSNRPFQAKLSLSFACVILIPLLVLAVLSLRLLSDSALEKGAKIAQQYLGQSVSNVEELLNYAASMSKVIVADDRVQAYFSDARQGQSTRRFEDKMLVQSFLDGIVEPKSNIASIVLYGLNGSNVACTKVQEKNIASYESYLEQLEYMDEYWGMPVYVYSSRNDYERGRPTTHYVTVLKPVISKETGAFIAVAELNFYEETICHFLELITQNTSATAIIMDGRRSIISDVDKSRLFQQAPPAILEAIAAREGSTVARIGGVDCLVAVMEFSKLDWTAVYAVPIGELVPEMRSQVALMLGFGLLCLLLSVVLSRGLVVALTKPIHRLVRSMNGVSQGDLSVHVKVEGTDEFALLSSSFNYMLDQVYALMDRVANERSQKRQSQLLALQAQINPHFLYNTLESICYLIRLNRRDHAYEMVKCLESFYRTCLSDGKNIIPLGKEFENVRSYLNIQKTRYFDKLDYVVSLDESLAGYMIVKLSVQPLVENAIYHGVRLKSGMGYITVEGCRDGSDILVTVRDNGPGFTDECARQVLSENMSAGYGLYNVNERIKLHFGEGYGVEIDHEASGGHVSVRIKQSTDQTEQKP